MRFSTTGGCLRAFSCSPSHIANRSSRACCARRWTRMRASSGSSHELKSKRVRYAMARILVIDDDQPVRATIKLVLETQGFEVVAVESGRAGKKAVEATSFDAAIVDVFMPEMD